MPEPPLLALKQLVARLRAPDGCPWDRDQTLADVRPYLLEEAHEVAAGLDSGDLDEVAGELGDLLFQTVFTAVLVEEAGGPDLIAIVGRVIDKMVERHPHVFGDEKLDTADEVNRAWETRKARQTAPDRSILDGVPTSLPALVAAYRLTQKAAGVGFDWPDRRGVLAKVDEELGELRDSLPENHLDRPGSETTAELGDVLFSLVNLARHVDADPEGALAATNLKFRRRFAFIEQQLAAANQSLAEAGLGEFERLWEKAKQRERGAADSSD